MGFSDKAAAAISIIGGADGPTSIFLAGKLSQTAILGPIAVAAYSYMSLVPIIQPPIMKLFTTEKERKIKMEQLRPVSKLEKILFPIVITIVVCMILPTTAPLVGMLMLGNLFRECGVVKQLTETASNALMYIVVILLGTSVGASTSAEAFLNVDPLTWNDHQVLLANHQLNAFKPLLTRIDPVKVQAMTDASKEDLVASQTDTGSAAPQGNGELVKEPLAAEIEFDTFAAVDLRVALILKAEAVEGADKLLRLTLDIGDEQRNVFSGIKSAYPNPAELEGRLTMMIANLKPRKMRFGISEGMVMAAGPGGEEIYLLSPDSGAKPGQRIK